MSASSRSRAVPAALLLLTACTGTPRPIEQVTIHAPGSATAKVTLNQRGKKALELNKKFTVK